MVLMLSKFGMPSHLFSVHCVWEGAGRAVTEKGGNKYFLEENSVEYFSELKTVAERGVNILAFIIVCVSVCRKLRDMHVPIVCFNV